MRDWCEGCEDRDKLIHRLKQQIKELEQENERLKAVKNAYKEAAFPIIYSSGHKK